MKSTVFSFLMVVSLSFAQTESLPGLYLAGMTNDGTNLYLFGGITVANAGKSLGKTLGKLSDDLWKYSPDQNIWVKTNPPAPRPSARVRHHVGYLPDTNAVLVFGGDNNSSLLFTDLWEYSIKENKWREIPQQPLPSDPTKYAYGVAYTPSGFYVIGGVNSSNSVSIRDNFYYHFKTKTWQKKREFPASNTEVIGAAAFKPDTTAQPQPSFFKKQSADTVKIFIFTKEGTNQIYIYNILADTWTTQLTTGEIPELRYIPIFVAFGKKLYFGSGMLKYQGIKNFYELDTDTWVWTRRADLPEKLFGSAVTAMKGKLYVYGGIDTTFFTTNNFYEYDIATDTWNRKSALIKDPQQTFVEETKALPRGFVLSQNYPNPFNPSTVIEYVVPAGTHIRLAIYDVLGQKVKTLVDKYQKTGHYQATFNGNDLPGGIYFYTLMADHFVQTKKMLLVK